MDATVGLDELIRGCQRRDPSAFDRLVDLYSTRLYGFMCKFTGNREDAQDLTQEVFVRVVRTIGTYEHTDRFESWLFRIAANLGRDRLRRLRAAPRMEPWVDKPEEIEPQVRRGPNAMEGAEAAQRMQECLAKLPEAEREVVLLRFYSEMSFAEIAELMGTPLGTALARAHRGLGKLRGWMAGETP